MKRVKWLITLADGKPLLFSVALLLIAVTVLAAVVINLENKNMDCERLKMELQADYSRRTDSIVDRMNRREAQLNLEVKEVLNSMIEDYKQQLEEQKIINSTVKKTIRKNKKIINTANNKLKNL